MQLTSEQDQFKQLFATSLRSKITEEGKTLAIGDEYKIAHEFVEALIRFKEELSQHDRAYQQIQGETSWSLEREKLIKDFSKTLDNIFQAIGGINPEDCSAYWSGAGIVQARLHGIDFGNTTVGFVVNAVSRVLQETFMPQAYTADGALDTGTNLAMWDAMSRLYAQNTLEDAHVFLVDGETSHQSIFWNTELQTLRERQFEGMVNEIYLHTLKPDYITMYRELLNMKHDPEHQTLQAQAEIKERINAILQSNDYWTHTKLDDTQAFVLKTSGFTQDHTSVNYLKIKEMASHWRKNGSEKKEPPSDEGNRFGRN